MADIEGSSVAVAGTDDDKIKYIELVKPTKRYVRLVFVNDASNATAQSAVYIQGGPRTKPVTHDSNVEGEMHVSPDEGTA